MVNRSGAAWYSGAGDRYTVSSPNAEQHRAEGGRRPAVVAERDVGERGLMPLGRPVVPEL